MESEAGGVSFHAAPVFWPRLKGDEDDRLFFGLGIDVRKHVDVRNRTDPLVERNVLVLSGVCFRFDGDVRDDRGRAGGAASPRAV